DGMANLVEAMESGYGTIDTAANTVCFTPTTAGTYEFTLSVTDSCGVADEDVAVVDVSFGEVAEITCPTGPVDVSLCAAEQVCYQLDVSPASATLSSSFGTITNNELCFMADTTGTYAITVIADESCGSDTCEIVFNVDIGQAADITCPDPQSLFICEAGEVCIPITVMTPGATIDVSPIGHYNAGNICFPADTSGYYEIAIVATTDCGTDSCSIVADITINSNPIADEPTSPVDTFICATDQICYQFTASDIDGGDLTWSRVSGAGTVSASGEWCFTGGGKSTYTVCAAVTDECGTADTVCMTYNVTLNAPPTLAFQGDTTAFLCGAEQVCFNYTANDPNDNLVSEELLTAFGTIDAVANEICFEPDTVGIYVFTVKATDACDASANGTFTVHVSFNHPPLADAGDDRTVFQCAPEEICWPASCTDADDNLTACEIISAVGSYSGGSICFTPDTAGMYTFIIQATDACGRTDLDTTMVEVGLNTPPVCEVPEDTSFFQCTPTAVSLPVSASDVDANFDHCELVSGPGSISNGYWTYTPSADQTVMIKVMCLDECGAACEDSFFVDFEINKAPVVDLGSDASLFTCGSQSICLPALVSDVNSNLDQVELLSQQGTYSPTSGEICFTPSSEGNYQFILQATDLCGATDTDTLRVAVDFNAPPTLNIPPDFIAYLDEPGEVCFDVSSEDEDNNLSGVTVDPFGSYSPVTDQVCFQADTSGTYCLVVTANDACGASTVDSLCIEVVIDECIHVQIEKTHNAIQGNVSEVSIFLNGSGKELGGFSFLVAYDASALTVQNVSEGAIFEDCSWEYFSYRHGDDGNCGSACPSGLLQIVGFAETNNGAYHPGCFLEGMIGSLADIRFLVSDDRSLECQYAPVQFFWTECSDNTFSSRMGDTLWISRHVWDFEHSYDMADNSYGFPGYLGAPDQCLIGGGPGKPAPIRCVDFTNGGVDIVCADSIDARADINLNGVSYEVADAVLLSNYFVYGISVFNVNVDGQVAASDVNADGITLSVADLVYLIRVIVGDSPPTLKISPNEAMAAEFSVKGDVLSITEAEYSIGAIWVVLEGEANPSLHRDADHMDMRYNFDGQDTRVLIYNMSGDAFLGEGNVLDLNGNSSVKSVEVGSYDGFVMASSVAELPDHYHLAQNYPNPFNPSTTFEFALPEAADWELVVFNLLGQKVETWSGTNEAGYMRIQWDAGSYASGVYFYRLKAGDFSATKKMVLLK
ncbi:T9SS type A sorting domain-containing protein, partial [candidate division GN15 bacterium]|nr:T9SS type A sorting domain-containing protein [candidate division GN15 bacterium]